MCAKNTEINSEYVVIVSFPNRPFFHFSILFFAVLQIIVYLCTRQHDKQEKTKYEVKQKNSNKKQTVQTKLSGAILPHQVPHSQGTNEQTIIITNQ